MSDYSRTIQQVMDVIYDNSACNEGGCWLYQGRTKHGYGMIRYQGKEQSVHRLSYERYIGPLGPDQVRHTCDTPNCWNPDHLIRGTNQDNRDDSVKRKRHSHGERRPSAKLTEEQVIAIRQSSDRGIDLARQYKVSPQVICDVRNRRTWRHI